MNTTGEREESSVVRFIIVLLSSDDCTATLSSMQLINLFVLTTEYLMIQFMIDNWLDYEDIILNDNQERRQRERDGTRELRKIIT